jgi:hypothetical protein
VAVGFRCTGAIAPDVWNTGAGHLSGQDERPLNALMVSNFLTLVRRTIVNLICKLVIKNESFIFLMLSAWLIAYQC